MQNERLQGLKSILRNLEAKQEGKGHDLVISIDFGTTYSGVGYVFSSKPDESHVVTSWPGLGIGKVSPKVPTVMVYSRPDEFKWGFEVGQLASNKIEAFKLLLDPSLKQPLYTSAVAVQKELNRLKKTAADATRDFMRSLCQWALSHIEDRHSADYFEISTLRFVLSIPAVWPEKAKRDTLKAAKDAGIDPIVQITEPEAAAHFTFRSTAAISAGLQVGDAITVCDAGGGTVDLISYEIKSLKPFKVIELTTGTGCLAGSLMLNRKFEDLLKQVIDEEEFFKLRRTDVFRRAMLKFDEDIKPNYVSTSQKSYLIDFQGTRLTDQPKLNLKGNCFTLTKDRLERIFSPVMKEVNDAIAAQKVRVRLVRQEKNRENLASVKAIFLVGGFGANKRLYEYVEAHNPGVKIVQPNKSWSAVIEGSTFRHRPARTTAFDVSPSIPKWYSASMKSPCHYGLACSSLWKADLHANETKYWDAWEGVWRCTTTTWCIKKGETVSGTRRIALQFYRQCPPHPSEDDLAIKAILMESKALHPSKNTDDASTTTNTTITVELRTLPHDLFRKRTRKSDGKDYWEIRYMLVLEIKNGEIWFFVEIDNVEYEKRVVRVGGSIVKNDS